MIKCFFLLLNLLECNYEKGEKWNFGLLEFASADFVVSLYALIGVSSFIFEVSMTLLFMLDGLVADQLLSQTFKLNQINTMSFCCSFLRYCFHILKTALVFM